MRYCACFQLNTTESTSTREFLHDDKVRVDPKFNDFSFHDHFPIGQAISRFGLKFARQKMLHQNGPCKCACSSLPPIPVVDMTSKMASEHEPTDESKPCTTHVGETGLAATAIETVVVASTHTLSLSKRSGRARIVNVFPRAQSKRVQVD